MKLFTHKNASIIGIIVDESATHYTIEKEDGDCIIWPKETTTILEELTQGPEIYDALEHLDFTFKPSDYIPATKAWLLREIHAMDPHNTAKERMNKAQLASIWNRLKEEWN